MLRNWFVGGPAAKDEPPAVSNEEKLHTMRQKRAALQRRHDAIRQAMQACVAEAQRYGSAGQKSLALDALRRKAVHEREFKQVSDLMRTMDQQLSAIDTASLSATVATSMRDGASVMTSVHADLDVAAIERDMVDMRIKTRQAEHATRMMTRPLFSHDDGDYDDDVDEDEQEALSAELSAILASESVLEAAAPPQSEPSFPSTPDTVLVSSLSSTTAVKSARDAERELGL